MVQDRYDLHCHSVFSDGEKTPQELIVMANQLSLKGLSITDHDTVEAYNNELFEFAKSLDVVLVPGVEFSCDHEGQSVHVLGYNYDFKASAMKSFLDHCQLIRHKRNLAVLKKMEIVGIPLSLEDLQNVSRHNLSQIGRVHFAKAMVAKGYVSSVKVAFDLYLKDGARCYVYIQKPSPKEAVDVLHKAGGKAVLAHPYQIRKQRIIFDLLKEGFDGIECYYAKLSKDIEKRWLKMAEKNQMLCTGGSDYHGDIRPYNMLGSSWVLESEVDKLLQ